MQNIFKVFGLFPVYHLFFLLTNLSVSVKRREVSECVLPVKFRLLLSLLFLNLKLEYSKLTTWFSEYTRGTFRLHLKSGNSERDGLSVLFSFFSLPVVNFCRKKIATNFSYDIVYYARFELYNFHFDNYSRENSGEVMW